MTYRLLPHLSPATSIEDAAKQRGIDAKKMVKSILLRDMDNNYMLACISGSTPVDPKKIRPILNCRRITCATANEVLPITGYQIGTITPLLLKSSMPIFFDLGLLDMQEVTISSGNNMAGLALNIHDLISLCSPEIADIARN